MSAYWTDSFPYSSVILFFLCEDSTFIFHASRNCRKTFMETSCWISLPNAASILISRMWLIFGDEGMGICCADLVRPAMVSLRLAAVPGCPLVLSKRSGARFGENLRSAALCDQALWFQQFRAAISYAFDRSMTCSRKGRRHLPHFAVVATGRLKSTDGVTASASRTTSKRRSLADRREKIRAVSLRTTELRNNL